MWSDVKFAHASWLKQWLYIGLMAALHYRPVLITAGRRDWLEDQEKMVEMLYQRQLEENAAQAEDRP